MSRVASMPSRSRQLNVHHHDVGPQVGRHPDRLGAVPGLAGHGQTGFAFQQHSKSKTLQLLVIGDQHAGHAQDLPRRRTGR